MLIPIGKTIAQTRIDAIRIESSGVIGIYGWTPEPGEVQAPTLTLDRSEIPLNAIYRTYRPDVAQALGVADHYRGFCAEFVITESAAKVKVRASLGRRAFFKDTIDLVVNPPHYRELLTDATVRHRDQIYAYGPPSDHTPDGVVKLIDLIPPGASVLDFGCGRGNMIELLSAAGRPASGIEIDREDIRTHLLPSVADDVVLYEGEFPLPYEDDQFDWVMAVEVIEHVPDYQQALAEIRRVARHGFIMTVPDASAIPRLFAQHVVPWHLLESTHFNFFTTQSLTATLEPLWPQVSFLKMGAVEINETLFDTSVVAMCSTGS